MREHEDVLTALRFLDGYQDDATREQARLMLMVLLISGRFTLSAAMSAVRGLLAWPEQEPGGE